MGVSCPLSVRKTAAFVGFRKDRMPATGLWQLAAKWMKGRNSGQGGIRYYALYLKSSGLRLSSHSFN